MPRPDLPATAAWSHRGLRAGFEVVYATRVDGGHVLTGCTTAVEDGRTWVVDYEISTDEGWRTRRAVVRSRTADGLAALVLERDEERGWTIDGVPAPALEGCLDVDLESSALTNTLPVHRLGLGVGASASTPAAFVRADGLGVERLDQTYTRLPDADGRQQYAYAAPAFDFATTLAYDASLLVASYPGIAVRVA